MAIKVENQASVKVPKNAEEAIQSALDAVPREHLRGLSKVVLVDRIIPERRVAMPANISELPGLYHPKQGPSQPWFEIAVSALLPADSFFKRLAARLNFKPNLVYLVLSLQAQHYYLTLSHGIKKNQYEGAVRSYVEQYHNAWREKQGGWRVKLFKPLRPFLEKWTKSLRKKYQAEQKRKSA
ncbi:MAG: hypothetical protein JNJ50_07105 [Acidobacteria bacterium]|nr:hypothetical protein [Acidobacteriota bacterium]